MRSEADIRSRLNRVEQDEDRELCEEASWAAQLRHQGLEREAMVLEWVLGERSVLPPLMGVPSNSGEDIAAAMGEL